MTAPEALTLPSLQDLQTAEQMKLLDTVDSLRAQGLGNIMALPQLVVCGDQSSGKSSVLEAISGVPFPRQENICTRFATELILRRAPNDAIAVSIAPAKDRNQADRDRLMQFQHRLTSKAGFVDLFEKAKVAMGLSDSGKSFSKDVLRIEFWGPTQPQLTLVDLPGITHTPTKFQTQADVDLVKDLVDSYLSNDRSIILAVISAKNDIANQIILTRARMVDPQGMRTLGIITKPDTLQKDSPSEKGFLALARNENVKFELGWHVVKNQETKPKVDTKDTRDAEESSFFRESNFQNLRPEFVGIVPLRKRLSTVLFDQIRVELPKLATEIESRLEECNVQKNKLGPGRNTLAEQKFFLNELGHSFYNICQNAIKGDYQHPFFQVDLKPERRLCANLMKFHFEFADKVQKEGATWDIVNHVGQESKPHDSITRIDALTDVYEYQKSNRGPELPGFPNPYLVGHLFRLHSRPWKQLALDHIRRVWDVVKAFLELALRYLTDEDVSNQLMHTWLYPIMELKLTNAKAKLEELLDVHNDYPMTTNHSFANNRKALQQKASQQNLEKRLKDGFLSTDKLSVGDISRIISDSTSGVDVDMDMIAAEDAFDNMRAYYEIAKTLFIDNVPTLVVQATIVRKVPEMFCSKVVLGMEDETVTKIAKESSENLRIREELNERLAALEVGARLCQQYALRSRPGKEENLLGSSQERRSSLVRYHKGLNFEEEL